MTRLAALSASTALLTHTWQVRRLDPEAKKAIGDDKRAIVSIHQIAFQKRIDRMLRV